MIMKSIVAVLFLAIFYVEADHVVKDPVIRAEIGEIRGNAYNKTRFGKQIYAFRGIPYAEPPVGENRFRPAIPVKRRAGGFDGTQEAPACPNSASKRISEDCLTLNVYITKLPSKHENIKKPVIVFFHPGGFYAFSSQSYVFGPEYLLDQDIVLLTVNYRLATLGFISTGDAEAPGNLGLKDQVESLRWIKRNIAAFGGDPDCVTITGMSAGSQSVDLHMLSPMTKGLFHRAISLSSAPTKPEPLPTEQMRLAVKQAQFLDCPTTSSREILACLRTKNASDFGTTISRFFEWYGDPTLVWSPVVEPEIEGVERYLTDQPVKLIRLGKIHPVPLITGVSRDEFASKVVYFVERAKSGNDSMFREMNDNWHTVAPISFMYQRGTQRSREISTALRQFYFGNKTINVETADDLGRLYADAITIFPVHRFAKLMASAGKAPVYFYQFAYPGRYSWVMWKDTNKPYGVAHHDDLFYLFYMSFRVPFFPVGVPETRTVNRMTSIWAHFAKTGEPIPRDHPDFQNVVWEPFSAEKDNYLEIANELKMRRGLNPDRLNTWERIFPLPPLNKE